jgi:sialic acid synthase SpsE
MSSANHDPISINGREITSSNPYVITEIGTNHNRDIETAKELIDVTAAAGADAVKYQIYHPEDIVTEGISAEEYGFDEFYPEDTAMEVYEKHLTTPKEWFPELCDYAAEQGLDNIATVHCRDCTSFVAECDMDAFKVASMDLTTLPLLAEIASYDKPIILSTGMGSLAEIDDAVATIRKEATDWLALLHCVSQYPADPETMHLRNIPMLQSAFGLPVGLSDHTLSPWTSGFAVAHGASIIEKHITLDSSQQGPDHGFALEPDQLADLVEAVQAAGGSLGSTTRQLPDVGNREEYRRSVVADEAIVEGATIEEGDVRFARPGSGIEPEYIDRVLGSTAVRDIDAETPLQWDDIC